MANEVVFEQKYWEDGDILYGADMNRIEELFAGLYAQPEIQLVNDIIYIAKDTSPTLDFKVINARGNITLTVKDSANKIVYGPMRTHEREFSIELSPLNSIGQFDYRIFIEDSLSNTIDKKVIVEVLDISFKNITTNLTKVYYNAKSGLICNQSSNNILLPNELQFKSNIEFSSLKFYCSNVELVDGENCEIIIENENTTTIRNIQINKFSTEIIGINTKNTVLHFQAVIEKEGQKILANLWQRYYIIPENQNYEILEIDDLNSFTDNRSIISFKIKLLYVDAISNKPEKIKATLLKTSKIESETFSEVNSEENSPPEYEINITEKNQNDELTITFNSLKLDPTKYTIIWNINNQTIDDQTVFEVAEGSSYVKDGLLTYFSADDVINNNIWTDRKDSSQITLIGKYSQHIPEENEDSGIREGYHYVDFKPNAYGKFSIPNSNFEDANGLSIELYFKATNIGELQAPVMINEDKSIQFLFNKFYTFVNGQSKALSYSLLENTWHHLVYTVNTIANANNPEDITSFVKLYLNGCLVACTTINDTFDISSINKIFTLNTNLNGETITDSGNCSISKIRIYSKHLSSNEVIQNYSDCLEFQNKTLYQEFITRNNNENIARIYFIKKPNSDRPNGKISNYTNFSYLHSIDNKDASKKSAVNCYVVLYKGTDKKSFENMDVLLQGTSSLIYPVKNYRLNNYQKDSKNGSKRTENFLPFIEEKETIPPGWNESNGGDYVYTLKCDYMEHSHKNNTPTAMYYDEVLNKFPKDYAKSPPRQINNNDYRDTIQGFPVLVYYSDNPDNFTNTKLETKTEKELLDFCKPVGSYMFNLDKEAAALGFECNKNGDKDIPISKVTFKDYYFDHNNLSWVEQGKEFRYRFEEINVELNGNKEYYLYGFHKDTYEVIEIISTNFEINQSEEKITLLIQNTNFIPLCLSEMKNVDFNLGKTCVSLEGTVNTQVPGSATFYTYEESKDYLDLSKITNKYDYYADTLEPRFSSDEDNNYFNYYHLDKCIKFFKIIDIVSNNSQYTYNQDKAKEQFETLFDIGYCLIYYLQMMVFCQIDNVGKNAMFDSWDGEKFYPRPYDMDSQMGLSNIGEDKILVSAEINPQVINDINLKTDYINKDIIEKDQNKIRVSNFNTRNSKLWSFIAEAYAGTIKSLYSDLRKTVYQTDNIMTFVKDKTTSKISETQYNLDAQLKYLTYPPKSSSLDYLYVIAGNRDNRYQQFLEERLIFLDSLYEEGEFSPALQFRSYSTGEDGVQLFIRVKSPQYIKITSGQGYDAKVYVDPNYSFQFGEDGTLPGIKLSYTNKAQDKETSIYGFSNVSSLTNFGSAVPGSLKNLYTGTSLNNFEMNNSNKFTDGIAFESEKLTNISIQNFTTTDNSAINLEKAHYLKSLDLANSTTLQNIILPNNEDCPLEFINLQNNTALTSLTLENLSYLKYENLNLKGCNNLTSLTIKNCENLTNLNEILNNLLFLENLIVDNINISELILNKHPSLQNITIKNCSYLTKVEIKEVNNLKNLNLKEGNTKLNIIELSENYNLLELMIPTGNNLNILKIVKNTKLANLNKQNEDNNNTFNFQDVSGLTSFKLQSNNGVKYIKNLTYIGSMEQIFASAGALEEINNCIFTIPDGGNMQSAFAWANKLKIISNTKFNRHYNVRDFSACFNNTYSLYKLDAVSFSIYDSDITKPLWALDSQTCENKNGDMTKMVQLLLKFFLKCQLYNTDEDKINFLSLSTSFYRFGLHNNNDQEEATYTINLKESNNKYLWINDQNDNSSVELGKIRFALSSTFYDGFVTQISGDFGENEVSHLAYTFSGSRIETIDPIFQNIIQNSSIDNTVDGGVVTVVRQPEELFFNCNQLINLPSNFFSASLKGKINSLRSFLNGAKNFKNFVDSNNTDNKIPIADFLSSFTNLENADMMFKGTSITNLGNNLLQNPKLRSAQGIFANLKTKTPINISNVTLGPSERISPPTDINLAGLFFDSPSISGTLSENFFGNFKPCITSLGISNGAYDSPSRGGRRNYLLGAFGNTAISGYEATTFQNMTKLTDISYLFSKGIILTNELAENSENKNYQLYSQRLRNINFNDNNDIVSWGDINNNGIGTIHESTFSETNNIQKIEGAFMGNPFSTFPNSSDSFLGGQITSNEPLDLDISYLFANCSILQNNENGINNLLQYLNNKENISITKMNYTFANTNFVLGLPSLPFTELIEMNGTFMGIKYNGSLPLNYLKNSKQTLQKIDFIFGNSEITEITSPRIIVDNFLGDNLNFIITKEEIKNEGLLEKTIIEIPKNIFPINTNFNDLVKLNIFYKEGSDTIHFERTFNIIDEDTDDELIFYIESSEEINITNWNYIELIQEGFLGNCPNLISCKGAFSDCNISTFNNYLFASKQSTLNNQLENISYLFSNHIKRNKLLPSIPNDIEIINIVDCDHINNQIFSNFFDNTPNLVNIEGIFQGLKTNIINTETNNIGFTLDFSSLNNLQKITNASYSFANIINIMKDADINSQFLFNTNLIQTLTNCEYIFARTKLNSISNPFTYGSGARNAITKFNGAFYNTSPETIIVPNKNNYSTYLNSINYSWAVNANGNNDYANEGWKNDSLSGDTGTTISNQISNIMKYHINAQINPYITGLKYLNLQE